MSKGGQAPIGFTAAPPPSAPPSYAQAVGGVAPQAPYQPQMVAPVQQPFILQQGAPAMIVTTVVPLGPQSTHMICPHCHHEVDTATKTSPSKTAWLSCILLCCLGCDFGCCLIPFCMEDCMNTEHTCPHCKTFLGQYNKT